MKRTFRIAAQACFLLTLCLCSSNALLAQGACSDIVGTWEHQLENQNGLFMATETHAIWLVVDKDRVPFGTEPPTEAEKVRAYDGLIAAAMTHTCEGNTVTVQFLHHKNPNATGSGFTWQYEIEGDELTYWILNEDGSRGEEGRARRVKD